jgi:hypothetical protein
MSTYFELPPPAGAFDPAAAATSAIESGADGLLVDRAALPAEFFDLSSGVAGELLHRLSVYGIRMAGVVPDPSSHSGPFQDFLRESNRGKQFRFFPTREEAIRWLESD